MKKAYPPRPSEWKEVVFANECDEDGNCPKCGIDYAECSCPGPTQDDLFVYRWFGCRLFARPRTEWD